MLKWMGLSCTDELYRLCLKCYFKRRGKKVTVSDPLDSHADTHTRTHTEICSELTTFTEQKISLVAHPMVGGWDLFSLSFCFLHLSGIHFFHQKLKPKPLCRILPTSLRMGVRVVGRWLLKSALFRPQRPCLKSSYNPVKGQNLWALCTAVAIFTALVEAAWTSETL